MSFFSILRVTFFDIYINSIESILFISCFDSTEHVIEYWIFRNSITTIFISLRIFVFIDNFISKIMHNMFLIERIYLTVMNHNYKNVYLFVI